MICANNITNDVSFKNSNDGYAISDNGKYYKTADGSKTW